MVENKYCDKGGADPIVRRAGESELDFHKRIVYGKLVNKTLSDMDYSELAEALYGQSYSSDVARRMMYGSKRTLDVFESEAENSISSEDILCDIEQSKRELRAERQRLFDQRREYNKILSRDGRQSNLEDRLVEAARRLPDTVGTVSVVVSTPSGNETDRRNGREAILVLCDWHYGMIADNVWNEYSTDICKSRVETVIGEACDRAILHGCSKIHVVVLGDLIHGAIHTSARVASEELVCDQIINVSEILAQSVSILARYFDEVCVHMTYGNHARVVQNKKDSIHRDNMERLILWWLRQRLKSVENVSVCDESDNEFIFFNSCGYGFCASHGDLDSVKSSSRLLPTLFQKKYGRDIDYILLADKHHRESYEELGVDSVICGCLCGTDEYANEKRLYSTPEQLMLIVEDGYGVDAEYHLKC